MNDKEEMKTLPILEIENINLEDMDVVSRKLME